MQRLLAVLMIAVMAVAGGCGRERILSDDEKEQEDGPGIVIGECPHFSYDEVQSRIEHGQAARDAGVPMEEYLDTVLSATAPADLPCVVEIAYAVYGETDLAVVAMASPTSGVNQVSVRLTAEALNGTIPYSYAWTASPPVTITGADAAFASATVTQTTALTCAVTDGTGGTASDIVTVTVSHAITVTASGPSAASGGESIDLVAQTANSTGPVSFSWLVAAVGTAGNLYIDNSTSETATVVFSPDAAGVFTFQVTAHDSIGSASDTISIAVGG